MRQSRIVQNARWGGGRRWGGTGLNAIALIQLPGNIPFVLELFMISAAVLYLVEFRPLKSQPAGRYEKERRVLRAVLWVYGLAGAAGLVGLKILGWLVY